MHFLIISQMNNENNIIINCNPNKDKNNINLFYCK